MVVLCSDASLVWKFALFLLLCAQVSEIVHRLWGPGSARHSVVLSTRL